MRVSDPNLQPEHHHTLDIQHMSCLIIEFVRYGTTHHLPCPPWLPWPPRWPAQELKEGRGGIRALLLSTPRPPYSTRSSESPSRELSFNKEHGQTHTCRLSSSSRLESECGYLPFGMPKSIPESLGSTQGVLRIRAAIWSWVVLVVCLVFFLNLSLCAVAEVLCSIFFVLFFVP